MAKQNFGVIAGDTLSFDYTLTEAAAEGSIFFFTAKRGADEDDGDDEAPIRMDSESTYAGGGFTLSDDRLTLQIETPNWQSKKLIGGVAYIYDVKIKTLTGRIYTIAYGSLSVTPDVTNRTDPGALESLELLAGNNLSELTSVVTALRNLGLTDAEGRFYVAPHLRITTGDVPSFEKYVGPTPTDWVTVWTP